MYIYIYSHLMLFIYLYFYIFISLCKIYNYVTLARAELILFWLRKSFRSDASPCHMMFYFQHHVSDFAQKYFFHAITSFALNLSICTFPKSWKEVPGAGWGDAQSWYGGLSPLGYPRSSRDDQWTRSIPRHSCTRWTHSFLVAQVLQIRRFTMPHDVLFSTSCLWLCTEIFLPCNYQLCLEPFHLHFPNFRQMKRWIPSNLNIV